MSYSMIVTMKFPIPPLLLMFWFREILITMNKTRTYGNTILFIFFNYFIYLFILFNYLFINFSLSISDLNFTNP